MSPVPVRIGTLAPLLMGFALGCGPPPSSAPPVKPTGVGQHLLPDDMDVAARLDVRRLSGVLGAPLTWKLLADALVPEEDAPGAALLVRALPRTELMWIGLRGEAAAASKVLLLRGLFADWESWPEVIPHWTAIGEGHPVRARRHALPGAFVRLEMVGDGLLLVSHQAAGSNTDAPAEPVEPLVAPERGIVAAATRPEQLRETLIERFPRLAGYLLSAERFSGYAELRAADLELVLDLEFRDRARALSARDVVALLLERLARDPCVTGRVAQATELFVPVDSLHVEVKLPETLVQALQACVFGGTCCA